MCSIKVWLEATRPKTLTAALCPVLVGTALAMNEERFEWLPALVCLLFALLVQIGTNFANDYLDGIKGTDTKERLGPRRAVASGLIDSNLMKFAAVLVLSAAFILGLSLIPYGGRWLLIVGIASVLCAWLYTGGPYPLAYNGLGDVFVILFFGFVAVGCTYYVQVSSISVSALLLGLACGLVVNNILVINNYRDVDEDRKASKRTLVVLFGRPFAQMQYLFSLIVVCAILIFMLVDGYGPFVLLGILALLPGFMTGLKLGTMSTADDFFVALKRSAAVVALFGTLVSAGLLL